MPSARTLAKTLAKTSGQNRQPVSLSPVGLNNAHRLAKEILRSLGAGTGDLADRLTVGVTPRYMGLEFEARPGEVRKS
jgi:hypothetical protein